MLNSSEIRFSSLSDLSEMLSGEKASSEEITKAFLNLAEKENENIGAFLTIAPEQAIASARESDKRRSRGAPLSHFDGIPIALKDVFVTKGMRTTCSSKMLENYIPPYDGTVVEKLKNMGFIIFGKLSMDEFAMGTSNEHSAFGPVKNPWDLARTPGGSSGGSAAAIAAGLTPVSLGTDTGGSVRLPAAYCGIVGLKPTYGRISRYGVVAFASSLDQVGPMTRNVSDCAAMLSAIAGYDPKDSTSIPGDLPNYHSLLSGKIDGLRIGIPSEFFSGGIDDEVRSSIENAIKTCEKLGAKTVSISLPHAKYAVPCYYIIATAEASSNLARYDGIRYGFSAKRNLSLDDLMKASRTAGFGPEVSLRIIVGTYVLSSGYYDAYYLKAQKVRTLIKEDFFDAFKKCDLIMSPTSTSCAFKLGERSDDPVQMYLNDIFTSPVNLSGLPGMSIPCGFSREGLPIGLQIIGRPLDEGRMLNVAYAYEQTTEWKTRRPPI
ncbi:MAG TPA: Asp-tRNA(Asn)/Glu-tRNA(Gln) amidotransferase subunit GatA [bacterium]|nr:MAG: Glutamyl-tRNA(Gln) amidotransferase subunit A [bacterium ADurb.Bin270]HPW44978.1 Asp-tRNA(Asn)/Glu-tRNA(Gln) amidotransferase subunit GatA [bacterium]HQC50367.1 Asp-tRNA(Asn)/Glu-tRNA(Gln) amidotransferase subunit GatA [bacterium]HQG12745.1 Asp-tRNA(Asn)/Glu-tRNA(Gln) amidotransferase subunit GatA [bacterium]HQH80713.1 Asp-tRNA(Asn)/Glu-tRNA(Gln) amidotransferase subunit GatA [bacterium]